MIMKKALPFFSLCSFVLLLSACGGKIRPIKNPVKAAKTIKKANAKKVAVQNKYAKEIAIIKQYQIKKISKAEATQQIKDLILVQHNQGDKNAPANQWSFNLYYDTIRHFPYAYYKHYLSKNDTSFSQLRNYVLAIDTQFVHLSEQDNKKITEIDDCYTCVAEAFRLLCCDIEVTKEDIEFKKHLTQMQTIYGAAVLISR